MINSLNPLNELSDIYLGNISEDNSPEAIKARVMQHVRAIRYRARKEGETLNKAYNEFMGGQSGISSTEKQMVKERLGLTGGSAHVGEEVVRGTSTNAAGEKIPWKVTTRGGKSTVSDKFGSRELRSASPKSGKKIDKMKEGYQRNPEEGERKERAAAKKGEAIRGQARRQMPPRGNKDREEFERWYAANVR